MATKEPKLKNCPFCGSKPALPTWISKKYHFVICCDEKCKINPETNWYSSRARAIMWWNRRKFKRTFIGTPAIPVYIYKWLGGAFFWRLKKCLD